MSDDATFHDAIRNALDREMPSARVRAALARADGFDPALWKLMSDLGWLRVHIPEEDGGLGGTFAQACLILRELGRKCIPSPFFASAILATGALLGSGNKHLRKTYLPRLAEGTARGTLAFGGASGQVAEFGYRCRSRDGAYVIAGKADFVLDAHLADFVVVCARSEDGEPILFLVETRRPGVEIALVPAFDVTRRLCRVTLDDLTLAPENRLSAPGEGARLFDHLIQAAAIGLAAESLGGAEEVLGQTVAYVKIREQFGRPVGSFQAVKHGCAEMLLLVESSRVAAEHAAESVTLGEGLSSEAASIAKSYVVDAYCKVVGSGLQYHGAIGFTWSNDMHLHFKRSSFARSIFGSSGWHLDRLAESFIDGSKEAERSTPLPSDPRLETAGAGGG